MGVSNNFLQNIKAIFYCHLYTLYFQLAGLSIDGRGETDVFPLAKWAEGDSNPHGVSPPDPKSGASATSAIRPATKFYPNLGSGESRPYRTRTCDPLIKSQLLYQLS